jgi:hypothetical protein
MRDAVEAEPEENLTQVDVDEWAAALAHHFAVACPVLKTDDIWMEPAKPVTIDMSWDQTRYFSSAASTRNFPGERIVVHVPFDGEADVFKLRTSTFSTTIPRGRVHGNDLLLTIDYPRDQPPNVDAHAEGFVAQVTKYLGWAANEIDAFNAGLERGAREAIEARRQRVMKREAQLSQSRIPIRRPGDSAKKTYIADVLVRRPAPSLPLEQSIH